MISASNTPLHAATEYLTLVVGGEFVRSDVDGAIDVLPKNTQQISAILEYATKNGLTVDPRGGGTKQRWGEGTAPHIRLCLLRLNRVLDHSWQDLTCTVQAGCTWSLLQQHLAKHGQFVALIHYSATALQWAASLQRMIPALCVIATAVFAIW